MDHYFGFNTPESRKKQRKAALTEIGEKATNFFWDVAPEYGFEMREGQQDMSFEIVDALIHNQHFAVEAGVGIGKSFGYLVPVLLYKKKLNKPVIVATSTCALPISAVALRLFLRCLFRFFILRRRTPPSPTADPRFSRLLQ